MPLCVQSYSEWLEHAIAYGDKSLHRAELKLHITDKEALALVEGIQHFKHYSKSRICCVNWQCVCQISTENQRLCQVNLEDRVFYFIVTTSRSSTVMELKFQLTAYLDNSMTVLRFQINPTYTNFFSMSITKNTQKLFKFI